MNTRYCVPYDRPVTEADTMATAKGTGMVPTATAFSPAAAFPSLTFRLVGVAVPHSCTTYFTEPVSDKLTKTLIDVPPAFMLTD